MQEPGFLQIRQARVHLPQRELGGGLVEVDEPGVARLAGEELCVYFWRGGLVDYVCVFVYILSAHQHTDTPTSIARLYASRPLSRSPRAMWALPLLLHA